MKQKANFSKFSGKMAIKGTKIPSKSLIPHFLLTTLNYSFKNS